MGWLSGIVTFILIWWVVIFTTLPLKIERNKGDVDGVPAGAPEQAHLKFKLILTTIISCVLWLIYFALVETGVLSHEIFF